VLHQLTINFYAIKECHMTDLNYRTLADFYSSLVFIIVFEMR
jgi:hypothetical protein